MKATENVDLFSPLILGAGALQLANRIVMAPMTRSRADENDAPTAMNAEYYAQRVSADLIITEGAQPSLNGKGYPRTPGIHLQTQIEGWRRVSEAVHAKNGKIFMQIMHTGRIASALNKSPGAETLAPSAVKAGGMMFTDQQGLVEMDTPRALELKKIPAVIEEFRRATVNAFEAGMDGVELHAASGYLPMQFLSTNTNLRTDKYGGSVENRARFVVETLEAMASVAGAGRVGLKISPAFAFNDVQDDDPIATYRYLVRQINGMGLAYLHTQLPPQFIEEVSPGANSDKYLDRVAFLREHYDGILMASGDLTFDTGTEAVKNGHLDLVAYGRLFIANPDLPERFRRGVELSVPDTDRFYTPGPEGYTDYPRFDD